MLKSKQTLSGNIHQDLKEDGIDSVYVILIIVAGVALCMIFLVVVIFLVKKAKRKEEETEQWQDNNPMYGLYHRGWDGEGDYGDGDQMEVEDTNAYYGT
jgi:flagellar basal body-associated protein FliL